MLLFHLRMLGHEHVFCAWHTSSSLIALGRLLLCLYRRWTRVQQMVFMVFDAVPWFVTVG
jgi:hypothetical protein